MVSSIWSSASRATRSTTPDKCNSSSACTRSNNMASIRKEFTVNDRPEDVWDAIRDIGAIHTRLAQGCVTDTRLEEDSRVVTFANGVVVRELIVDVDDAARRLVYAVAGWQTTHHNASFQVFADGDRSRVVWITDLLPNTLA